MRRGGSWAEGCRGKRRAVCVYGLTPHTYTHDHVPHTQPLTLIEHPCEQAIKVVEREADEIATGAELPVRDCIVVADESQDRTGIAWWGRSEERRQAEEDAGNGAGYGWRWQMRKWAVSGTSEADMGAELSGSSVKRSTHRSGWARRGEPRSV